MFAMGGNPYLIASTRMNYLVTDLDSCSIIQNNPQFRACGMRLQAETLSRLNHHQRYRYFLIMSELLEISPGAGNQLDWWVLVWDLLCFIICHQFYPCLPSMRGPLSPPFLQA